MRALVMVMALVGTAGCRFAEPPKRRSPLVPLAAAADAVTLEVFAAPSPPDDPQWSALWATVDEQPLPAELRQQLAQNGFRAGIAGPNVPDALAALLKVTDDPISEEKRTSAPLDSEDGIRLIVMQPRSGQRRDLVTSPTHERVSILQRVGDEVKGKTYLKAEARLILQASTEVDGRTRVELSPELQFGEMKNRFASSEGMYTLRQERERRPFPELKISATLSPGQMLLVTSLPDRPSSVGHCFFTHTGGEQPVQKLYVFRVAQATPDRSFYAGPTPTAGEMTSSTEATAHVSDTNAETP
jgi:hypothetical protein